MERVIPIPPVTESMIQDVVERIVREFDPEKIILFGSHADGSARPESDLDLLVIMRTTERPMERALPILRRCRPRFVGMDVVVRTPEEIEERQRANDPFFHEALKGRVLYERPVR